MSTEDGITAAPNLRNRFDTKNEVNEENISVNLLRKSSLSRSKVNQNTSIFHIHICLVNVS